MRLRMMILEKAVSHNKSVNVRKLTYSEWQRKLSEECTELHESIGLHDKTKIAEEVLDVVQVCFGIIAKLVREGLLIDIMVHKHNKKLINRGCRESAVVNFSVVRRH